MPSICADLQIGKLLGSAEMKNFILKNRFTLLLTALTAYIAVLVAEGAITGREAQLLDFDNPFFEFNVNNLEEFIENRQ